MAITRTTTTVTEHFGSSAEAMDFSGTQAPSSGSTNFESMKSNFSPTQTSADLRESPSTTVEAKNFSSDADVERFSKELSGWLGQHTIKIVLYILSFAVAVLVGIWAIASKIGKAESQFETVSATVQELKTDNKQNLERLVKIEVKLDKQQKK